MVLLFCWSNLLGKSVNIRVCRTFVCVTQIDLIYSLFTPPTCAFSPILPPSPLVLTHFYPADPWSLPGYKIPGGIL